jgi:hypothetical protein
MAQTANMTAREISMERRRLSYETGKAGLQKMAGGQDRTRGDEMAKAGTVARAVRQPVAPTPKSSSAPAATLDMNRPAVQARPGKRIENPTRAASLARRQAMSTSGKRAITASAGTRETTRADLIKTRSGGAAEQTARQDNAPVNKIGSMEKKIRPTGRIRPGQRVQGAAQDANWKVGASETTHGQTVTGTMLGQSPNVTGEDPGTGGEITGTDYDGADAPRTPRKVSVTSTASGNSISGTNFNRSAKVTGDEPGTCKNITGNQYVGAGQANEFCGTSANGGKRTITGNNPSRAGKVTGGHRVAQRNSSAAASVTSSANGARGWAKGRQSTTLLGGTVTGTRIGRGRSVTGDERGSCLNVTGDEYVGQEQYNTFCDTTPMRTDRKVNVSATLRNQAVTGTLAGRESKVTGDEPGTCKAVTGTPYTGADTYNDFCDADATAVAMNRARRGRATPGMPMTGLQPGIGGKLTGAGKGACEPLTGTPYVGVDQFGDACPGNPAGNADGANGFWGEFSVDAPSHASRTAAEHSAITGTQYERGRITGPFGMGNGKVTGTEEARFSNGGNAPAQGYVPTTVDSRVKSRVTGEGQDAGLKITGDDWDRNERVTGTEGLSATRRNPTRRGTGGAMAMEQARQKRNESLPPPSSKVTGSSGNTEKGSLITYSGGARG